MTATKWTRCAGSIGLVLLLGGCAEVDTTPEVLVARSTDLGARPTQFGAACASNPNVVGGCTRGEDVEAFYFLWDGDEASSIRELQAQLEQLRSNGEWQSLEELRWVGVSVLAGAESSCAAVNSSRSAQFSCNDSDVRNADLWIAADAIHDEGFRQWAQIGRSDICNQLLTHTKQWAEEDEELSPRIETTVDWYDSFRFISASMWSPSDLSFFTYRDPIKDWVRCTYEE